METLTHTHADVLRLFEHCDHLDDRVIAAYAGVALPTLQQLRQCCREPTHSPARRRIVRALEELADHS